jgi:hypothetical protein
MATEIITTDDLREFKIELLDEIKQLLKNTTANHLKNGLNPTKSVRS